MLHAEENEKTEFITGNFRRKVSIIISGYEKMALAKRPHGPNILITGNLYELSSLVFFVYSLPVSFFYKREQVELNGTSLFPNYNESQSTRSFI